MARASSSYVQVFSMNRNKSPKPKRKPSDEIDQMVEYTLEQLDAIKKDSEELEERMNSGGPRTRMKWQEQER